MTQGDSRRRAWIRAAALAIALGCLLVALPARAGMVKFGLFVGNDAGGPGDPELVFAEADAAKMRDLFVDFGGVKVGDAHLLQGVPARSVQHELDALRVDIAEAKLAGNDATLVFYFSGHGDADGLHLGTSQIPHEDLRNWLDGSGATVRIAMVDACQSGGLVRRKGGVRGPSFAFAEPTAESAHGTAIITSSAESELSQESDEIGGGFFTYFLHTALTGAADRNHDGDVTLSEAYAYVHTETTFNTRDAPATQTPAWDLDLAGSGDIVLTTLEEASARISFIGGLEGPFSVWDESRKRYVAQVAGDAAVSLAVRPGTFYVHRRMPAWVEEARYTVRRGETHTVLPEDFVTVSYESAASRGDLRKQVRRSKVPDLSLRFTTGFRFFGKNAESYVPPHAIGGVQATFLGKRPHYTSFDLRTGGTVTQLQIEGLAPIQSTITSSSLGGSIGIATPPAIVRTGFGARSTITLVTRRFADWDLVEPQSRATIGAGFDSWVGLHIGRFSGDFSFDWQTLVMKWDDNPGWPSCADLQLAFGYRF